MYLFEYLYLYPYLFLCCFCINIPNAPCLFLKACGLYLFQYCTGAISRKKVSNVTEHQDTTQNNSQSDAMQGIVPRYNTTVRDLITK